MEWNVKDYNVNASYVSEYGQGILELLSPQPEESILDLGCGDGKLTEKISLSGCHVIGIDSSEAMICEAQKRGIDAKVSSSEEIDYQNQFDAVFSNAALHWMKDANSVIRNVYRSLKPGGRFCAELGGINNVNTIVTEIYTQLSKRNLDGELYNPWYFPDKEEYCMKLVKAGFVIKYAEIFKRLTLLPTDVAGWLKTFAKPFLRNISKNQHDDFIQSVMIGVADKLQNDQGQWFADYVRLRFIAKKKVF